MKLLKVVLLPAAAAVLATLGFIYSGVYPVAADDAHTRPVYWALETLRERSIAARTGSIRVPPLDDYRLLLSGGADYDAMCAGCHLKPGKAASDLSAGLYPAPPNLAMPAGMHDEAKDGHDHGDRAAAAARQFWIIKHGLKMTAMPAWGATHDDERIWAMVAFLQKLPTLTPEQYQILTAPAPAAPATDRSALPQGGALPVASGAAPDTVLVYKSPSCHCCAKWINHLRHAGFTVETRDEPAMAALKTRLGIPPGLASCHTAQVGGYVIEGHVPAGDILRLLAERPRARGLAVPGMPIGSPGMEQDGRVDPYEVLLFSGDAAPAVFARHGTAQAP